MKNSGRTLLESISYADRESALACKTRLLIATVSALGLGWPLSSVAQAQSSSPPAAATQTAANQSTDTGGSLAEVVVTAQRREEVAQRVPVTVAAVSTNTAAAMGIQTTQQLTDMVPSLNISNQPLEMISLRGIATTGTSINNEQSVAQYIDGVYLFGPYSNNFPINGLDHIEVLYGPQGTLFGRNTTGGVIQYVSRNPTSDTVEASAGYGNYSTVTADLYASHKFSDTFAMNVAIDYRDQNDGFGTNLSQPHERTMYTDYLSAMVKAVWTPTPSTKITGLFWYDHTQSSGFPTKPLNGEVSPDGSVVNLGHFQFNYNTRDEAFDNSYLGYIRVDQDLGFAKFVSLTSGRYDPNRLYLDADASPVTIINSTLIQPSQAVSQEFQLQSEDSSPVKWTAGLYYFNSMAAFHPIKLAGLAFGPDPDSELDVYGTQLTRSYAAFGQATFKLFDDRTHLTLGFRYTDETEYERNHYCVPGFACSGVGSPLGPSPANQSVSSSGPTGRVSLDHQFTDDVMGYVSYNHGLKSGGFSLLVFNTDAPSYHPETVDAYEVGFKSELLDHRLRFNASGYYYNFSNIQVETINVLVLTANAAKATIYGADFDMEAIPVRNLTIRASLGLLHTQYDSYNGAPYYLENPFVAAPPGVYGKGGPGSPCVSGATGLTQCFFDAKGKRLNFAPEVTWNLGATYKVPTNFGDFIADVNADYESEDFQGPDNNFPIPAHTLVNAALGWNSPGGRYGVRVWARNLLGTNYDNMVEETTFGALFMPGEPRTYGVTLSTKW